MLLNILKAATSVALTPVAVVADVLTMPASAERGDAHPFGRTGALLSNAGECIADAVRPDSREPD